MHANRAIQSTNTSLSPVGTNSAVRTGRSPGFSVIGGGSLPGQSTSGFISRASSVTVAGPRRLRTGFPIKLCRYAKHLFPYVVDPDCASAEAFVRLRMIIYASARNDKFFLPHFISRDIAYPCQPVQKNQDEIAFVRPQMIAGADNEKRLPGMIPAVLLPSAMLLFLSIIATEDSLSCNASVRSPYRHGR